MNNIYSYGGIIPYPRLQDGANRRVKYIFTFFIFKPVALCHSGPQIFNIYQSDP
jgi:hypothetical protein